MQLSVLRSPFFFFNDTATTEIYTLSLHDALPIYIQFVAPIAPGHTGTPCRVGEASFRATGTPLASLESLQVTRPYGVAKRDRKSTRLNSSHQIISYAVFCLKKKKHSLARAHIYRQ